MNHTDFAWFCMTMPDGHLSYWARVAGKQLDSGQQSLGLDNSEWEEVTSGLLWGGGIRFIFVYLFF